MKQSAIKRDSYEEQITLYKRQIEALNKKEDDDVDESVLGELRSQLQLYCADYDSLKKEIDLLKKSILHLGDDGIKAKLVSRYIPIINEQINNYLQKMDLFVQFELDEQFNETIKSRYRDTFSYASFSEGEKLRIDIALMLTWREISKKRNSVSSNLLLLDEIFDGSFDIDGARDFLSILNENDADNIIVISHKTEVQDGFDNIITATKTGNFTEYTKQ